MPRLSPYGYQRSVAPFEVPNQILAAAGALDLVTALAPGFAFEIERVTYVAHTVHTGGGATKTFTIKKGSVTVATLVVPVASVGTNGAVVTGTITAANASYADTDTFTISANAGTVFSLGAGSIRIIIRQRAQRLA